MGTIDTFLTKFYPRPLAKFLKTERRFGNTENFLNLISIFSLVWNLHTPNSPILPLKPKQNHQPNRSLISHSVKSTKKKINRIKPNQKRRRACASGILKLCKKNMPTTTRQKSNFNFLKTNFWLFTNSQTTA